MRRVVWSLLLGASVAASVAVPVAGQGVAAPPETPVAFGPAQYTLTREAIGRAARLAAGRGDTTRAASLRAMAAPSRTFLAFDGHDGGTAIEVVGSLPARTVAVVVPGAGTTLDAYGRLRGGTTRLQAALGPGSAVVAWLGYPTPRLLSLASVTTARADAAAPRLRGFLTRLAAAHPGARISLLCHSYGAVVCARAAPGLPVENLVLYGAAGVPAPSAAALGGGAAVWAGRGSGDWIGGVPAVFGPDPTAPGFGARRFDAGDAGHGDYLSGRSLASIARIVAHA
ncbi:alpha/beta hydrolase [Herbidospora cretacea]|uniref:alpha/beta hydrolase n=1 Tax=Herbidospora cretacea TaxID=28444 RepID=UPI0004C438C3|nr:alpha/beta hydrolase [Herbidospora cretacea]